MNRDNACRQNNFPHNASQCLQSENGNLSLLDYTDNRICTALHIHVAEPNHIMLSLLLSFLVSGTPLQFHDWSLSSSGRIGFIAPGLLWTRIP